MYFSKILLCLAVAVATTAAETIQLEPTQGILIPAPIAQSLRFARASYGGGPSYGGAAPAPAAAPSYAPPAAPPAYKPASIPSPPCPKNYLFSCQPSLSPVPCAAPAPSYSSPQGAYSQYEPQYAYPVVRELY